MSRSIQRSKCTRVGCLTCNPHKATGERPIAEARALTVEADLAANDHGAINWDYDEPECHCSECRRWTVVHDRYRRLARARTCFVAPLTFRPFAMAA